MKLIRLTIAFMFTALVGCDSDTSQNLSVAVKHYAGGAGITVIYSIDKDGLQVDTDCDLSNCKETTVFKRRFSKIERDSVMATLNSFQLDTLKSSYKHQGYYADGFFTEIKIKKGLFFTHKSTFDNIYTPTTKRLNDFIDNLIVKPEFRLATWGQPK